MIRPASVTQRGGTPVYRSALYAGLIVAAVRLLAWAPAWSAGRLPFNTDGWFTPVLGHWYAAALSGGSAMAFYPVGHFAAFGDPQVLPAVSMWLLELAAGRFAAIWSFWLFWPAFYAAGWAALATTVGLGSQAATLLALFVTCNNYFWAVTDDLIWVLPFWLPFGLLAMQLLVRHWRWIVPGILFGLQAYTGVYPYMLQTGFLVSVALARLALPTHDTLPGSGNLWRALALSLALALPLFVWLAQARTTLEPTDPLRARTVLYTTGLQPDDFVRHLDSVLIYPATAYRQPPPNPWVAQRRVAGTGLVLPLLALAGMVALGARAGLTSLALLAVWLTIAMGPVVYTRDGMIRVPMLWVYDHIPMAEFFRVPSRAFGVVVLGLALLAAYAWRRVQNRWMPGYAGTLVAVWVGAVFLIENTPVPAPAWDNGVLLSAPDVELSAGELAAFIPSDLGWDVRFADRAIHPYGREAAYVLAALDLGLRVPNGVNSYIPPERIAWRNRLRRWQVQPQSWLADPEAATLIVQPDLALPEERDMVNRLLAALRDECRELEKVWVCVPPRH